MYLKKRYYLYIFSFVILFSLILSFTFSTNNSFTKVFTATQASSEENTKKAFKFTNELILPKDAYTNGELRVNILKEKIARLSKKVEKSREIIFNSKLSSSKPNYNVHIFYYAWYGNKQIDGAYKHWNHSYLPNWKREIRKTSPSGSHTPILDIGSNFYPALGCYSSNSPSIINTHFSLLNRAGVGVVVVSWTPKNFTDSPHKTLPLLFKYALKNKLRIALHIEPYLNRNPINFAKQLKSFLKQYGNHPALYKIKKPLSAQTIPVVYIYDSYLTPAVAWKELLSPKGNLSIRGTAFDAIFLGLLVDLQHRYHIKKSHFDGFYTYFGTNGFSYGSSWKNWKNLSKFALQNGLIFVPSVAPGYVDTQVRPWNSANTRHRRHGQYYDVAWRTAITANTNFVSITSFNEWHEGTQIEPAVPKTTPRFVYLDYQPEGPEYYINLTKWWVQQYSNTL